MVTVYQAAVLSGSDVRPTLDLDFIAMAASQVLDQRVTFSRGSLATRIGPTGLMEWAPHNLLSRSEEFGDAVWQLFGTGAAKVGLHTDGDTPTGQGTAYVVNVGSVGGANIATRSAVFQSGLNFSAATTYTVSVWVKALTGTVPFSFTLQTDSSNVGSSDLLATTTWQRFSFSAFVGAPASGRNIALRAALAGGTVGDMAVWGAQVNFGAVQPYCRSDSTAFHGPRFTYDPVTLAPLGLLIEEQRTNLLLNSVIAGTNLSTQSVTVSAVAHTLSFYGTGTVTLSGVSTDGPLVGSSAYPARSTLTFTPTAGSLTLTVNGTVQFAQIEAGAFATSYIPTAGATATRSADVVTLEASAVSASGDRSIVLTHAAPSGRVLIGGGSTAILTSAGAGASGAAYSAAETVIVHNGGGPTPSGALTLGSTLRILGSSSAQASATVARLRGFPRALPAATLQRLTS